MGIADVVGGLLIYDAVQQGRADRQFDRQLDAQMKLAEAEYLALRRARPADIRALLPLEYAYRVAIRVAMSSFERHSTLTEDFANDDFWRDFILRRNDEFFRHDPLKGYMPQVDHLRAVALLPRGVEQKLDTPCVRAMASASDSAREIWREAAAYAELLVRLIEAVATQDLAKIGSVAAEYDRFAPTMEAFWTDLYPVFATVLRWQRDWDRLVPQPVGFPEEHPFVDEEDLLTGWKVPESWERSYDEVIAAYEAPVT